MGFKKNYRLVLEFTAEAPDELQRDERWRGRDNDQVCVDAARSLGMTGILFQETAQVLTEVQACLAAADNEETRIS